MANSPFPYNFELSYGKHQGRVEMTSVLIIAMPQLANIIHIWIHEKNICISCHNITQEQHQKNTIPVSAFLYRYSFAETKRGADMQTNPSRAHRVYMLHHPKPVSMVTRAEEPTTAFTATLKYIFPLEFRRSRVTTPIIQWSTTRRLLKSCFNALPSATFESSSNML